MIPPCKNCITFAICKSQVGTRNSYGDVVTKLLPKCTILSKFVKSPPRYTYAYSPSRVDKVAKYLRG